MTDTTLRRPTLADTFRAVGGLLRRKGLVLAALALALNGGLQFFAKLLQSAEPWGRLDLIRIGLIPSLVQWFGLAMARGAVAALCLSDLQGDITSPRVIALKTIMRWPALLLVTAGLEFVQLMSLLAMLAIYQNPFQDPAPMKLAVASSSFADLAFCVFFGLTIPVLMQERGGPVRSLRRGWRLSKGARVTLLILALIWMFAAGGETFLSQKMAGSLFVKRGLDLAIQSLLSGLWVASMAVVYLQQRRALGQLPATAIGEVFG